MKLTVACMPLPSSQSGASSTAGDFSVQLESARRLDEDITLHSLRLTPLTGGPGRLICQYHYHAWPDHGIPRSTRPLRRLARLLVPPRTPSLSQSLRRTLYPFADAIQVGNAVVGRMPGASP